MTWARSAIVPLEVGVRSRGMPTASAKRSGPWVGRRCGLPGPTSRTASRRGPMPQTRAARRPRCRGAGPVDGGPDGGGVACPPRATAARPALPRPRPDQVTARHRNNQAASVYARLRARSGPAAAPAGPASGGRRPSWLWNGGLPTTTWKPPAELIRPGQRRRRPASADDCQPPRRRFAGPQRQRRLGHRQAYGIDVGAPQQMADHLATPRRRAVQSPGGGDEEGAPAARRIADSDRRRCAQSVERPGSPADPPASGA